LIQTGHQKMRANAAMLLPPLAVVGLLWATSERDTGLVATASALLFTFLVWTAYLQWRRTSCREPPLLALVMLAYWMAYAFPLFWGDLKAVGTSAETDHVNPELLGPAMVLAVVGASSLWLGYRSSAGRRFVTQRVAELKPITFSRWYIYSLLGIGTALSYATNSAFLLGDGARQALSLLATIVPTTAFCFLFRLIMRREASALDKGAVVLYCAVRFFAGMASGWLGSAGWIAVLCILIYILERGRVPKSAVFLLLAFVFFYEVGKQDFRQVYWHTNQNSSMTERVAFWTARSANNWQTALTDASGSEARQLAYGTLRRFNLLSHTAHVVELTPAVVPYQYGRLYSYFLITLVPRALWKDKPTINEANQFYQVEYGLSSEVELSRVSIAVGSMTEAFINFGWPGVVGIMFLIGILIDFYRRSFLTEEAGLFLNALGMSLVPSFLTIESQLAQYLAGILQMVFFTLILFLPVLRLHERSATHPLRRRGNRVRPSPFERSSAAAEAKLPAVAPTTLGQ
jgi:hypothetical protein